MCPDLTQFVQQEYASALGSATGLHDPSDACNEPYAVKGAVDLLICQHRQSPWEPQHWVVFVQHGQVGSCTQHLQHKTHQGYA